MVASVSTTSSGSSKPRGEDVLLKYGKNKSPGRGSAVVRRKSSSHAALVHVDEQPAQHSDSFDQEAGSLGDASSSINAFEVNAFKETLSKLTPEAVFALFDTDNDRVISFDEFKAILPRLGINVSMPKALRYFRTCDRNGNGFIDIDEFKMAMFAVDPDSGNPVGFSPNALLTPMDAFEMFDDDKSGFIDEDSFFFLLQFLGIEVSEEKQEQLFKQYDTDGSGAIDYDEFKKIWVRHANIRKELTDRNIKVHKFASNKQLTRRLAAILDEEEAREARALAEADRWGRWQALLRGKRVAHARAKRRAEVELKSALDAAGSVYVFGTGAYSEFAAEPPVECHQGNYKYEHWELLKEMWSRRVAPVVEVGIPLEKPASTSSEATAAAAKRSSAPDSDSILTGATVTDDVTVTSDAPVGESPSSEFSEDPERDPATSLFKRLAAGRSSVALWGKRVCQVALSDGTAFALSELGEVFAWGGRSHWWHDLVSESQWQQQWRGDVTERSKLLLQTVDKREPSDLAAPAPAPAAAAAAAGGGSGGSAMSAAGVHASSSSSSGSSYQGATAAVAEESSASDESTEGALIAKYKTVTEYFGVWKPPPTNEHLEYIREELLPRISFDAVKLSLACRGKHPEDANKLQLIDMLHSALVLEQRILGERLHKRIRQLELEVVSNTRRGRLTMAKSLRLEIENMWLPLAEIQAEDAAAARAAEEARKEKEYFRSEQVYRAWRESIAAARSHVSLPHATGQPLPELALSGLTDRAGASTTPMGVGVAVSICAGANHALLLHRTGQLYTWGLGVSGRLGLDTYNASGNPQADASYATLVTALSARPVIRASAGFNHTAAITAGGALWVWGSATTGKLGVGMCSHDSYLSSPARVLLGGSSDRKVKRVDCGAAHTAAVTAEGQVWVWGCADGGRLGIPVPSAVSTVYVPALVESLSHVRASSVSCGAAHTLIATAVTETVTGSGPDRMKVTSGGSVYQTGSAAALGSAASTLFLLAPQLEGLAIRHVSAGYSHSAAITGEGELYTWGSNKGGCCGHDTQLQFVNAPACVEALYRRPENLALGKRCRQSSIYCGSDASTAVNGDTAGDSARACTCTQQDPQAWWEVDLGATARIDHIRVWNRSDTPQDPSLDPDLYSKRLFPAWIMLSQQPFEGSVGGESLRTALGASRARCKLTDHKRCSVWRLPEQSSGRYIRVQIEGFDFLHLAEVQVFGTFSARRSPGRVTNVTAGKFVTAAVMRALPDPRDVEAAYKRAVQADPASADVLRQFETYVPFYDKHGRGDDISGCMLCCGGALCEFCALKHEYLGELQAIPLGPGGRLRRLDSIRDFLFDIEKPKLEMKQRKTRANRGGGVLGNLKSALFTGGKKQQQQSESADVSSDEDNVAALNDEDAAFFDDSNEAGADDSGSEGEQEQQQHATGKGKGATDTAAAASGKRASSGGGTNAVVTSLSSPLKSVLSLTRRNQVHP